MAAITPPVPPPPPATNPTADLAQTLPGADPLPVINAQETQLADYLNKPVNDILTRLGLAPLASPAQANHPPDAASPANPPPNPLDPTQLIKPATDALGTLGPGQFGSIDPSQMFETIAQAVESAGQSVGPALSSLQGLWQGSSGSAAVAKTGAALTNGNEVASQATDLRTSLLAAASSVAQARTRLVAIISEFAAKIAAIGPNIIFPWGMAAAIAAANEAVTETGEVITQIQSALSTQAAQASSTGTPVPVTSAPTDSGLPVMGTPVSSMPMSEASAQLPASPTPMSAFNAPVSAAASPAFGQALSPLVQLASSMASPAMEGVGAVTSAIQGATAGGSPPAGPTSDNNPPGDPSDPLKRALPGRGSAGIGGGNGGGAPTTSTRLASAMATPTSGSTVPGDPVAGVASAGMGGAPMLGGMPLGQRGKTGGDGSHRAAAYLHTTDQGDQMVGDLGAVGPPVLGERDAAERPDIDLRI